MGRPANIPGESYYSTQQTPDYLPPKSRGYFATYESVPATADTSKTEIKITYKWAEVARIANEVSVKENTSTVASSGSYVKYTGEVVNNDLAPIKSVRIYVVTFHNDGHVMEVASKTTVDEIVEVGKTSAFSFDLYGPKDKVKTILPVVVWGYQSDPPQRPPTPKLLGDLNGDGTVNFDDFFIFAQNFGKRL